MQPAAGLRLLLAFSLSPLLVLPATAQPRDDSANALIRDSIAAQLEALRNVRLDITAGRPLLEPGGRGPG